MTKKTYYIIITIIFAIIAIPTMISIIFHKPILINHINRPLLKVILIFTICGVESLFIKNMIFKIIGLSFTLLLYAGINRYVMHWAGGKELIIIAGLVTMVNVLLLGIIEKRISLITYFLIFFVLIRLFIILRHSGEFLWWTDVIICTIIPIIGLWYSLTKKELK